MWNGSPKLQTIWSYEKLFTQRRLDSSLQRFTGKISTNHDWEKPSCCRSWDELSHPKTPKMCDSVLETTKGYPILVKSNSWSIINAAFWLVELLLGNMLKSTSSESAGFLAAKKGLKTSFNQLKLFCLDIFDQLVGFYFGLMGYWLRAHSDSRNNC